MSVVTAKEILLQATKDKYAVGAFNITNLIQMEAVIETAIDKRAPLIIQTSVAPSKFLGRPVLAAIYRTLAESAPIPICLHLDHCKDVDYCKLCADAGWTNVMIDASSLPFEENVRQTKEVCDYAHARGGVSVEGELGTVFGAEDEIQVSEVQTALCSPTQAVEFVERTGVDLFAPAIGTVHGVYKVKSATVDFERFEKIAGLINGQGVKTPLVVHGGTGLPADYVQRLVALGGSKVNVSTELKRTLIDTTFDYISAHREEYNPGKLDIATKDAIREVTGRWIDVLGSAGKA
jgi:tagatose 1,6-diphosphate aldolase GatY/KbaY